MAYLIKKFRFSSLFVPFFILVFWFIVIIGVVFIASHSSWSNTKVINVLTWPGMFDSEILSAFSRSTGIKVNLSYYLTNEELFVTLKATQGKQYDLIVPSDYAVKVLRERGLLKELDKSRLNFISRINPLFMNHSFDARNEYSVPYIWEVYGIGYDRNYFKKPFINPRWGLIFEEPPNYRIAMTNDPLAAVNYAAYYLYGTQHIRGQQLTPQQGEEVKNLLVKQKKWVEVYTDVRPDYFLVTGDCPLVLTSLTNIARVKARHPSLDFVLPREGIFISIENFAIPCGTYKTDLVYNFLNYIYAPSTLERQLRRFTLVPATLERAPNMPFKDSINAIISMSRLEFDRNVLFFSPLISEGALHNLWISIKSR